MIRKAKINNAAYREDYNVLVLDVFFYDNDENKKLVLRAGKTTKKVADKNCESMIGKDIKLDMSAEFQQVDSEKQMNNNIVDASFRNYPFSESMKILKEESPESFPQEDEDGDPTAWYAFPGKQEFKEQEQKKKEQLNKQKKTKKRSRNKRRKKRNR